MEERDRNFMIGSTISTLEESLKQFDMPCLIEELDMNLELVRRNKETEKKLLDVLKLADKDLLKLSRIHHPDKAIGEKKLDEEVTNAQNLQIALNATRTVLKALTEVFLKDIDVHYKYEFFAKLNINTLINEKQIDHEINNVLCKISRLSEIKRVNIVGEIRKFLQESQECLVSFRGSNKYGFVRHRGNALHHLHTCIEGYKVLATECELTLEDCGVEKDENTRRVIQSIHEQSLSESKILQDLEEVAERSLDGNFEIFPIYEPRYCSSMKPMEYEPVAPKEHEYLVSPFKFYVDVLLMCSVMVDEKTRVKKFLSKIGNNIEYWLGINMEESIDFVKEPALLKAYYLASYINNKNHYKEKVHMILKEKGHHTPESNIIRKVFKEIVEEIEQLLAEQFDINSYKEGKSNREQFNERLFELNDSMAEFNEVRKNLLEKFKLYEQETDEIRKEYLKTSENIEKTEQQCQKDFSICESKKENVNEVTFNRNEIPKIGMFNKNKADGIESNGNVEDNRFEFKSVNGIEKLKDNLEEHEKNLCLPSCAQNISSPHLSTSNRDGYPTSIHAAQIVFDRYQEIFEGHDKNSKVNTEKIPSFNNAVSEEVQRNIKANNLLPGCISGDETADQTTQMVFDRYQDIFQGHNKNSKVDAEKIPSSNNAVSEEVQRNIKANNPFLECISRDETANQTTQMVFDQCQGIFQGRDKISEVDAKEITSFNRDQLQKEPINFQVSELESNELNRNLPRMYQNSREYEDEKTNKAEKIASNDSDEVHPDSWTII